MSNPKTLLSKTLLVLLFLGTVLFLSACTTPPDLPPEANESLAGACDKVGFCTVNETCYGPGAQHPYKPAICQNGAWEMTNPSCDTDQCSAEGECYDDTQQHPSNDTLCVRGAWTEAPLPSEVSTTLEKAETADKTTVYFTTEGFDIEDDPYHIHIKVDDGEHMVYNESPAVIPPTADEEICVVVADHTHEEVSEESCAQVENKRTPSIELDKATREAGDTTVYFSTTNYTNGEQYHTHFTASGSLLKMYFGQSPATLNTSADEVCAFVADENHEALTNKTCVDVQGVTDDGEQRWSNPDTWDDGVPGEGDVAAITKNMHVVLDESTPDLEAVRIHGGTLEFARKDVNLTAGNIMVMNGGELRIGSEEQPFRQEAVITLTGTRDDLPGNEHCGVKGLCAHGAKISLHGATGETWTKLADGATAEPGDTSITVAEQVDWEPGDTIVLASTDYDPGLTEERTVTSVDGRTVSFNEPLEYEHYSERETFSGDVLDQRAEVLNLDRNIVIQGDKQSDASNFGGHVMAMNEHHDEQMERVDDGEEYVDVWPEYDNNESLMPEVSGVEFRRMGQAGVLARYPFHWHLYGNASESYIEDSSIHNTFQRCVVVHGTQEARVENNVAFNATGHCYFLEDGAEANNALINNVASVVKPFSNDSRELIPSDSRPAGIWLRNINNRIIGNTVAGVFGYGIWIDSRAQGTGNPTGPSATDDIDLRRDVPVGEFGDNTVHSIANVWRHPYKNFVHENTVHQTGQQTGAGLFVEHLVGKGYQPAREFKGFTSYHNDGIGLWGASRGKVWIEDSITADVPVGIKARARTDDITVVGDTRNTGNPLDAGSGMVENNFTFEKTWYDMTLDDLHYYENRTGESLPAYMGLGLPQPDDLPFVGQENFYTGTVSKNVEYVNFEDEGIMNYTVFHTAPSPEAEGHWHWNTSFENAPLTMRPNVGGGGNNPSMFTMIDGDGSISGDGDYTEYRYYQYYESLAAHQAPPIEYRGEQRKRHISNRSRGPVEDIYITDDCEKIPGSPRLWECDSKTGFFTLKPQPWGQEFFSSPTVEDDSTGETFTDNSVHSWLPVNNTYHYRNGDALPDGFNIALSNVHAGDWLAFTFPANQPLDANTEASVARVESEERFYDDDSAAVVMYYDEEENLQYIKTYGGMTVNNAGVPVDKRSGGARFR